MTCVSMQQVKRRWNSNPSQHNANKTHKTEPQQISVWIIILIGEPFKDFIELLSMTGASKSITTEVPKLFDSPEGSV